MDEQEIAQARWYTPADLTAAEAEGLTLPGKGSIAGRMIDALAQRRARQLALGACQAARPERPVTTPWGSRSQPRDSPDARTADVSMARRTACGSPTSVTLWLALVTAV